MKWNKNKFLGRYEIMPLILPIVLLNAMFIQHLVQWLA